MLQKDQSHVRVWEGLEKEETELGAYVKYNSTDKNYDTILNQVFSPV